MKKLINSLKKVWPYMKSEKKHIFMYVMISVLSIVINIILPIVSAKVIVNLTENKLVELISIAIVLFIISIIKNLFTYFQTYLDINIYWNSFSKLQKKLNGELLKLQNKSIDSKNTGLFVERLTSDTGRITGFLNVLTENIPEILTGLGIIIAIFIIDIYAFFIVLISIIIRTILENKRSSKVVSKDKEYRLKKEKNNALISEITHGIKDIKMLNSEDNFLDEMTKRVKDIRDVNYNKQDVDRKYILGRNTLSDLFVLLLTLLLAYEVKSEVISISYALVIMNYSVSIPNFISSIGGLLDRIKDFNLSVERAFSILNDKEFDKEKFGNIHIDAIKGEFEFKNVNFSYDDIPVIKDMSFKVNPNETIAFVGKSGSGKSTIFNLLCKMYDINDGEILLDGINLNDLDKESIRGNITVINQNPYIFNMSLRDNFNIVKKGLTEEEMINACKMACIHDFINTLPDKYDTIIGEGGVNLSGGQKQRIAIARALIQDTKIILFDEATSALDNETQSKIQEAIDNMKDKYTIMIIAHRLSTIKNVDRILFVNDGKIEASGTHNNLIKKCSNYKKLYENEIISND